MLLRLLHGGLAMPSRILVTDKSCSVTFDGLPARIIRTVARELDLSTSESAVFCFLAGPEVVFQCTRLVQQLHIEDGAYLCAEILWSSFHNDNPRATRAQYERAMAWVCTFKKVRIRARKGGIFLVDRNFLPPLTPRTQE